ncbi:hypothetical protein QW71_27840 [Paenibacillus sp. IHB B 3415]|uniref:hypothetical protein n=1 Tax=Paenibacillus sp. IHB B 3415 TaxID=867080 RepID=UPI0005756397|nr:hypothetical protein [Paenibacillus sp. IHB B 3415]KHL92739.1 hypothetical protein QW71_27840 [Paenibacillus sp. IHB B 3415]
MYKELDNLLATDTTVDSWYDDGCVIASEMLTEFNPSDWDELSNQVLSKPIDWQKKLAYCLDNECNVLELNILLSLLDTNDEELFEICVDTLRSFTDQESKKLILDNPKILQRVNDLLYTANLPVKKILQDFLSKILL